MISKSWGIFHNISCSHKQASQPAGLGYAGSSDMKQAATCAALRQSEIRSELFASKGSSLLLLLVLLLPLGDGELPLLATGTRLPESGELLPLLSGLGLLLPPVFALFVFEAPARYCKASHHGCHSSVSLPAGRSTLLPRSSWAGEEP